MNAATTAKGLLVELGLSQAILSALVGRNPASISLWLRGAYRFTLPVEHEILWVLEDLKALVRSVPFPVDLRDAGVLRKALDDFRARRDSGQDSSLQATNRERVF